MLHDEKIIAVHLPPASEGRLVAISPSKRIFKDAPQKAPMYLYKEKGTLEGKGILEGKRY